MLTRLRERAKLTQQALADRVQVYQVTIARLETAARRPSGALLWRLAQVLHCRMEDLMQGPPRRRPAQRKRRSGPS